MNHKGIVFGLILAAMVPLVSAVNCWGINEMPEDSWSWSAWLCNSTQPAGYYKSGAGVYPFSIMMHGQIETEAPPGHPNASSVWRVYLVGFQHVSPYPATLKCYKRMGTSGRYWWWYTGQQVTLNSGQSTSDSGAWVLAGCPPVKNLAQLGGSPPKVQIGVGWSGYGRRSMGGAATAESTMPPVRTRSRR